MTYREFLTELKQLKRKWRINSDGRIRTTGKRCPLEAVARTGPYRVGEAMDILFPADPPRWASNVIYAADDPKAKAKVTRRDLLRAAKLKGVK